MRSGIGLALIPIGENRLPRLLLLRRQSIPGNAAHAQTNRRPQLAIVQGLCMATAFTLTLAYLGERCSRSAAAGALAAYVTGGVASNLIGRLAAAWVASLAGTEATFYFFAALNLAGAALAAFALTRTAPMAMPGAPDRPFWAAWAGHDHHGDGKRMPGAKSRWSAKKDLSWEPLRPELVVQVAYDHMQGTRFRHTAQFRRWRPDKPARECTYAQLEVVAPQELRALFGG